MRASPRVAIHYHIEEDRFDLGSCGVLYGYEGRFDRPKEQMRLFCRLPTENKNDHSIQSFFLPIELPEQPAIYRIISTRSGVYNAPLLRTQSLLQ